MDEEPTTFAEYVRACWKGLLFRQVVFWILIELVLAAAAKGDFANMWPVGMIAGVLLNIGWIWVA